MKRVFCVRTCNIYSVCILSENMTSSIKPELHKVLYCDQRKTKPRRQVACRVKLVKIENVVSEICERRNTQTDQADRNLATLRIPLSTQQHRRLHDLKGRCKGSPYSITERRVPELIPVLGSLQVA